MLKSTVVPDYMLRTEEQLLRYLWVKEGRSLSDFDMGEAQDLIHHRIQAELAQLKQTFDFLADELDAEAQAFFTRDTNFGEDMAYLSTLSMDELFALYNSAAIDIRPILDDGKYGYSDGSLPLNWEFYAEAYTDIQAMESGEITPEQAFDDGSYNPNLAEQDFLENFLDKDTSLSLLANFVLSAAREGIQLGSLVDDDFSFDPSDTLSSSLNFFDIYDALDARLGSDWNPNDFTQLLNSLTNEYYNAREKTEPQGISSAATERELQNVQQTSDANVVRFNDAIALDKLRSIAFDPNWNPARDGELLNQLAGHIDTMPRQILGVDVGFVPDQLQFYYESQKAVHDWRLELQTKMVQVDELERLNREQGIDDPLWWLPIVGETVLGFFDVFDAIFTIRDVVQHGDLAALGFLAFDILVPVLGDAVMSIRNASRGMDVLSPKLEEFIEAAERSDVFRNVEDASHVGFVPSRNQEAREAFIEAAKRIEDATDGRVIVDLNNYTIDAITSDTAWGRYRPGRKSLEITIEALDKGGDTMILVALHELYHALDFDALVGMSLTSVRYGTT